MKKSSIHSLLDAFVKIIQVALVVFQYIIIQNEFLKYALTVEDGLNEKELNAYFVRRFCENNPGIFFLLKTRTQFYFFKESLQEIHCSNCLKTSTSRPNTPNLKLSFLITKQL